MVSIFTSQTPVLPNQLASSVINLGTVFTTSAAGSVSAVRWFAGTDPPSNPVMYGLFTWTNDTAGTLLTSGNFGAITPGAWNQVSITPQVLTAGQYYVVVVLVRSGDHYAATGGFFNGVSVTNAPLTAPADDNIIPRHNGKFLEGVGSVSYPTSSFNGSCYFVDVVFDPAAPTNIQPDGIQLTVTLGAPTVSDSSMTIIPDGITIPVALGQPIVDGPDGPGRFDPVIGLYDQALTCLCQAAAEQPNPPLHCASRVGTEVLYDVGQYTDQCCEGLAYVMLGDTYISTTSFPEQDIVQQIRGNCAPPTWAQVIRIGLVRCISAGQQDGEPPSDETWALEARQNLYDSQTLRLAACCFRNWVNNQPGTFYDGMNVVIGRQIQTNPQGGCVERYVDLTVQFPDVDCLCG